MIIAMALQAALAAIELLRELGYLKKEDHQQIAQMLVNGHTPEGDEHGRG